MAGSLNTTNLLGAGTTANSPVHDVTRSQLISRAWRLARLNRRSLDISIKVDFGRWLRAAWAEAREGRTHSWPIPSERAARLRVDLICLEHKERLDRADYQTIRILRAELTSLGC